MVNLTTIFDIKTFDQDIRDEKEDGTYKMMVIREIFI